MDGAEDRSGHEAIAQAFVAARHEARALDGYPGAIPETLELGYRVQDCAIALMRAPIGGWKVGRILPPLDARFGSDRIAGPIFADTIIAEDAGEPVSMPVFEEGFAAAEAELLVRLARTPTRGKRNFSIEDAAALIDAIHVGIEIASSPLAAINALGPTVTVSDFGNNHGLVVGAAIPVGDWDAAESWPVTLAIDGVEAGAGRARDLPDGPMGAVRFLLELMATRGRTLEAGQWISTGAITGVHRVTPGAEVEARFGADYAVRCTIAAATARL